MTAIQPHAPIEIATLLRECEGELAGVGIALIDDGKKKVEGALAALLSAVSKSSPALGCFSDDAVRHAFVASATARLLSELAKYDEEKHHEAFISDVADEIEALIGQALVQLGDAQGGLRHDVVDELGGASLAFESFRSEFQRALDGAETDLSIVCAGFSKASFDVGVRISARARQRLHAFDEEVESARRV